MRKKVCKVPPIKIDFEKSALDYLGFTDNDKLKLVLPCRGNKGAQQGLYREHVIYKMYQILDTLGFRTHLVNVVLEEDKKEKYDFIGFFIEDEKESTGCKSKDLSVRPRLVVVRHQWSLAFVHASIFVGRICRQHKRSHDLSAFRCFG